MVAEFRKFNDVVKKRRPEFVEGAKMVESLLNELSNRHIYPESAAEIFNSSQSQTQPAAISTPQKEKPVGATGEVQEDRFLNMMRLSKELGVSRTTIYGLVRKGKLHVYENPWDRRQKLLSVNEALSLYPKGYKPSK